MNTFEESDVFWSTLQYGHPFLLHATQIKLPHRSAKVSMLHIHLERRLLTLTKAAAAVVAIASFVIGKIFCS